MAKFNQSVLIIKSFIVIQLLVLVISCQMDAGTKKDWLFQATYDSGVGGCSIVFYKDSTCVWMAGMASNDKEGKYVMRDRLIILEGIPMETCLTSNKLLLTNLNPHQSVKGDTILVQVNSDLKVVDSTYIFRVYWNGSHTIAN